MRKSESIEEISKALSNAWKEIKNPKHNQTVKVKTKTGGSYQFEYTDLAGILEEIKPHLSENGLMVIQDTYTTDTENAFAVTVKTRILHESGEWIESNPLMFPVPNNIQDMGGLITYMKRYSLSAMLGISTEEDDDGNLASGNTAEFQNRKASTAQLNFVDKLLNDKVTDELPKQKLYEVLKNRMKTNVDMENWTSQQASNAIKILKGANNQMSNNLKRDLSETHQKHHGDNK